MGRDATRRRLRAGRTRYLLAGTILCFVAAVSAAGWFFLGYQRNRPPITGPAATPTASWREEMVARMGSAMPSLGGKVLENVARSYQAEQAHKAQAASIDPPRFWRASGRPTAENAEDSALENCQVNYGQPCGLIAVDDALEPIPGHDWPRRDMPRARYSGSFDPMQIPGSPPAVRERADVLGYGSAPASKAVAFTPVGGRVFVVLKAVTQRAAEEEALKACAAHPLRQAENGRCFLYAVGDRVVLPLRLAEPLTALSAAVPASRALREALAARLASTVPNLSDKVREERARGYETAQAHKAMAASPDAPGTWRSTMRPTAEDAETAVLEQCQVFFGRPCILITVDEAAQPMPPTGNWPRRDMPARATPPGSTRRKFRVSGRRRGSGQTLPTIAQSRVPRPRHITRMEAGFSL